MSAIPDRFVSTSKLQNLSIERSRAIPYSKTVEVDLVSYTNMCIQLKICICGARSSAGRDGYFAHKRSLDETEMKPSRRSFTFQFGLIADHCSLQNSATEIMCLMNEFAMKTKIASKVSHTRPLHAKTWTSPLQHCRLRSAANSL